MTTMTDLLHYVHTRLEDPELVGDWRGVRAEDFVLQWLKPYTEQRMRSGLYRRLVEHVLGEHLDAAMLIVGMETLESRLRRAADCFNFAPFTRRGG